MGILTFGQKEWKTDVFSTFYTAVTTIINAIDFRYNTSTDKNRSLSVVYYRVSNSSVVIIPQLMIRLLGPKGRWGAWGSKRILSF